MVKFCIALTLFITWINFNVAEARAEMNLQELMNNNAAEIKDKRSNYVECMMSETTYNTRRAICELCQNQYNRDYMLLHDCM